MNQQPKTKTPPAPPLKNVLQSMGHETHPGPTGAIAPGVVPAPGDDESLARAAAGAVGRRQGVSTAPVAASPSFTPVENPTPAGGSGSEDVLDRIGASIAEADSRFSSVPESPVPSVVASPQMTPPEVGEYVTRVMTAAQEAAMECIQQAEDEAERRASEIQDAAVLAASRTKRDAEREAKTMLAQVNSEMELLVSERLQRIAEITDGLIQLGDRIMQSSNNPAKMGAYLQMFVHELGEAANAAVRESAAATRTQLHSSATQERAQEGASDES